MLESSDSVRVIVRTRLVDYNRKRLRDRLGRVYPIMSSPAHNCSKGRASPCVLDGRAYGLVPWSLAHFSSKARLAFM